MVYENDKLDIPEEYRKMSVTELNRHIEEEKKKLQEDRNKGLVKKYWKAPTSLKVNWN